MICRECNFKIDDRFWCLKHHGSDTFFWRDKIKAIMASDHCDEFIPLTPRPTEMEAEHKSRVIGTYSTYDYGKPNEYWKGSIQVSAGMFKWIPRKRSGFKKSKAFIRVNAHGGQYDRLIFAMDGFKDALNNNMIKESDIKVKSIKLEKLERMLVEKSVEYCR